MRDYTEEDNNYYNKKPIIENKHENDDNENYDKLKKSKKYYLYTGSSKDLKTHDKFTKLGSTESIKDRLGTYITSYPMNPFQFELVFEIKCNNIQDIEKYITRDIPNTRMLNGNSGKEWFERSILTIEFIKQKLNKKKISFKILTKDEIENLNNKIRLRKKKEDLKKRRILSPHEYQDEVLNKLYEYYLTNNIANIEWTCGLGKTLLALFLIDKLESKRILICVPTRNLVTQWESCINENFSDLGKVIVLGPNSNEILKENICEKNIIILSTYHQSHKIVKAQNTKDFIFDIKIGDEAHHLTGIETKSILQYKKFHDIKSKNTLFLTATKKYYLKDIPENTVVYSMDNEKQFGKTIDVKTVLWAIKNKYLVDYSLVDIVNTQEEINEIMDELNIINILEETVYKEYPIFKDRDKLNQLFLASYIAIKEILNPKLNIDKLLIYTNNTNHADLVNYLCEIIINSKYFKIDKKNFYHNSLHSNKKDIIINDELKKFKTKKKGIISCVQIFGEGYNEPLLDGVVFAEKMESEIRIVQSSLRPHRLNPEKPNKHAYIIVPRINYEDCKEEGLDENPFEKIEQIGYHLRNIDENIFGKIKSINISKKKSKKRPEYKSKSFDDKQIQTNIVGRIKTRIRLARGAKLTIKKFCNILQDNNIFDSENYYKYLDINEVFNLPRYIEKTFPDFYWRMVDPNKDQYYEKDECIEKLKEIKKKYKKQIRKLNNRKKRKFMSEINSKIPNRVLWTYYGGTEQEFLGF